MECCRSERKQWVVDNCKFRDGMYLWHHELLRSKTLIVRSDANINIPPYRELPNFRRNMARVSFLELLFCLKMP